MTGDDIFNLFLRDLDANQSALQGSLQRALGSIRRHLQMDGALVAEFRQGKRWLIALDEATPGLYPLQVGASAALEDSLCYWIARSMLPGSMEDAKSSPAVAQLAPMIGEMEVGPYVAVPIHLNDGTIFGMLCCFSRSPRPPVRNSELTLMHTFADMIASNVMIMEGMHGTSSSLRLELTDILHRKRITPVFQPIRRLTDRALQGYEGLSRFPGQIKRNPAEIFEAAHSLGLGTELELLASQRILSAMRQSCPLPPGFISLNYSPQSLIEHMMNAPEELHGPNCTDCIIEISEQSAVSSYERLGARLRELRRSGLRFALDDVGAGNAGFRHILDLEPDMIKLDRRLILGLPSRRENRSMVTALRRFSDEIGCDLVAEGIETEEECRILIELGVPFGQGFLLGPPAPLPDQDEQPSSKIRSA